MIDREWLSDEEVERIATEAEDAGHGWAGKVKTISTHGFFSPEALRHFVKLVSSAVARKATEAERTAIDDLHESEALWAPIGHSAWGEGYQEGWGDGIKAYIEAIRARGTGGEG